MRANVESYPLEQKMTGVPYGRYSFRGNATPTGKRIKYWWGSRSDGGYIEVDEYTVQIDDPEYPNFRPVVVGCFKCDFNGNPVEPFYFLPRSVVSTGVEQPKGINNGSKPPRRSRRSADKKRT